jgi:hypothetical protein
MAKKDMGICTYCKLKPAVAMKDMKGFCRECYDYLKSGNEHLIKNKLKLKLDKKEV